MTADSSFEPTRKSLPVESLHEIENSRASFRETGAAALLPSDQILQGEAERHSISGSVESTNKLIEDGSIPALSLENIKKQWSRHEGEGTLKSIKGVVDSILLQLILEAGTQSLTSDAAIKKSE